MKIAFTNKMNKWFIDSFFNVDTILFSTPSEIIDGLEEHKPNVLVFGDLKNCFNDFETREIKEIISKNNINTLFYGGWQGFGLGNYKSTFFEDDMSLKFRDNELQMVIYKISTASENDFFSFSFEDCPEIAFYNKVDIFATNYKVILNWNDCESSYPLLLSKISNNRKQLLLLTSFTPPGGAKRLVLWNKYPSVWKEMLEWLGSEKLYYNKKEDNILISLLSNYWNDQLTHEFAKKILSTEIESYEEQKLLLMRDMYDRLGDWEMSSIVGNKYYLYNKKKHGETIHTLKSLAELTKIKAHFNIVQSRFLEASDDFEKGSKVWNEIVKKNQRLVTAKGFSFYYSGLSSLYYAFYYLNSSPQKAKKHTEKAVQLFKKAIELNGHSYSNVMLKLCRLIEIVLIHKIAKSNTIKSFLTDIFFLSDYKKAIIELNFLLKEYSDSIKFEHPPFSIDINLIENQDYKWYFEVGLISQEHYTILNTISHILREELIKFKKTFNKKQRRYYTEHINIDELINCVVDKTSKETEKTIHNTYYIYGSITNNETNIGKINANQVNLIENLNSVGVQLSRNEVNNIQNNLIIIEESTDEEIALLAKEEILRIVEEKFRTKPIPIKNDILNNLILLK